MYSDTYGARLRRFTKVITFDGTAGAGAQGTVAVGTVSGAIVVEQCVGYCTTDLAGASATIELGTSGVTNGLIAQTTATNIDAGEAWTDAGPSTLEGSVVNKVVSDDIILTVGTADITAGVLEITIYWRPASQTGNLG